MSVKRRLLSGRGGALEETGKHCVTKKNQKSIGK